MEEIELTQIETTPMGRLTYDEIFQEVRKMVAFRFGDDDDSIDIFGKPVKRSVIRRILAMPVDIDVKYFESRFTERSNNDIEGSRGRGESRED
jgi:deoxyribodipyrimidine photolyase-like uncharacterized protein